MTGANYTHFKHNNYNFACIGFKGSLVNRKHLNSDIIYSGNILIPITTNLLYFLLPSWMDTYLKNKLLVIHQMQWMVLVLMTIDLATFRLAAGNVT